MIKTFKDKKFLLSESTMKNTVFKENVSHHSNYVLKKLVLEDSSVNPENVEKMIKTKDISFEENYLFKKELENENFKLVNIQNYEYMLGDKKTNNIVLIQSTDNSINRNTREKLMESMKGLESNYKYFYMNGTKENKIFLEKKLNMKFESFPQIIVINDLGAKILPCEKYLKYSIDSKMLKSEISIFCDKLNKKI